MRTVLAAVLALTLAGCGGSSSSTGDAGTAPTGRLSLSEAFCNDLEAGLSPFQILNPMIQNGTYTPEEAADRAYGFAAIDCPEQLQSNEALRAYLEGWYIDLDA